MNRMLILICLISSLTLADGNAFAKQKTPAEALLLLGKSIYNDQNLSVGFNQSCKSCHNNKSGFADQANTKNPSKNVVSIGSDGISTGNLNAPTAAHAFGSPQMYWDGDLFIGGLFWNGRATGHKSFDVGCLVPGYGGILNSPLAEQAQGPFTNPVEMALPDNDTVVARVAAADYAYLFNLAFSTVDFTDVARTFDQIAIAIAYYEESNIMNQFNSVYDSGAMTSEQQAGEALFMDDANSNDGTGGGAMCVLCHVTEVTDVEDRPAFTDFSYDNLGIPINPIIAAKGVDPGLGGFIAQVLAAPPGDYPDSLVTQISAGDGAIANYNKHKVPTLRNVAITPPYGHNGFFPNLTSIVQFYNTRDPLACTNPAMTGAIPVTPALLDAGMIPGYNGVIGYCWPAPEATDPDHPTVNDVELGNLGLTNAEVDQIVAFLEALTDQ